MVPLFDDNIEAYFEGVTKEIIDQWFKDNATRKQFYMLANTTLDWSCEQDSITLGEDETLSVVLNGTFLDSNSKASSEYPVPTITYGALTKMFNL